MSVKKSGITTAINIDLADMGAPVRNLDNIAAHINSDLEGAEMISRFERVKIGEKDENGIVPGNNFGFKISGASTEVLTFSAASASPAIYIAGQFRPRRYCRRADHQADRHCLRDADIGIFTPHRGRGGRDHHRR